MGLTLQAIIAAAAQLPEKDRQSLIKALRPETPAADRHITELRGLGKEIWQGQDAQEYVDRQRDSWGN